jgi:riboflavin kinase / FMN adenylyltransferase
MQIFRGIDPRRAPLHERAVTIGNFDGVHRGHQALIKETKRRALEQGLASTVVTFEPHPKAFFNRENAPGKIHGLRDKAAALAEMGVDEFWILPFRQSLAAMSAEDFMQRFLNRTLKTKTIVIGDDFCFGARRRGNLDMLQSASPVFGWQVQRIHTVLIDQDRASSSSLRQALQRGDLQAAGHMMGRPYRLSGHVIHGRKLGRDLGFPTLNIPVPKGLVLAGIFVVSVHGLGITAQPAVASLGHRPTVETAGRLLLEVHCLNWSGDAYGRVVTVEFHQKLRDEIHYDTVAEMTAQIQADADNAHHYFKDHVH